MDYILSDIAWPTIILVAWIAGEFGHKWLKIPRISIYSTIGFIVAPSQLGVLPKVKSDSMLLLANIAFGLILFECGYRMNVRWLKANPWIGISSLVESSLTACAVYLISITWDLPVTTALLLSALAMATSPAAIVRVINEHRSSGQVTERALHLSALNCVLAVFTFKVILGFTVFRTSGSLWQAIYNSGIVLMLSVILGTTMGCVMPTLLRAVKRTCTDSTLAFAIAVIVLTSMAHSLKLSPVLAALTFGLVSRHRRIVMNPSQRGFGALGDLLSVLLFVFVASALEWQHIVNGFWLGLGIIGARQAAKMVGIAMFSHISGISWRKGWLTGLAMTPLSAFVILVLEQTRHIGVDLVDQFAPLAATAVVLELLGPIGTWLALKWSHELPQHQEY